MKQFLLLSFFFGLLSLFGKEYNSDNARPHLVPGDTLRAKRTQADTAVRFAYAEMVFQRSNNSTMWVEGEYVSKNLKKLIAESKHKSWGLAYMGEDGWELVSVLYDQFSFHFYFKKKIKY